MSFGNITTIERVQRLTKIKELLDEGTGKTIANEVGMTLNALRRNIKYLKDLKVSDLSVEEISKKRAEMYLELLDATAEAKAMFERYKKDDKHVAARMFFSSWLESIQLRMKLYGLDAVKPEQFVQINQQFVTAEPERVNTDIGNKIANILKEKHESTLRKSIQETV